MTKQPELSQPTQADLDRMSKATEELFAKAEQILSDYDKDLFALNRERAEREMLEVLFYDFAKRKGTMIKALATVQFPYAITNYRLARASHWEMKYTRAIELAYTYDAVKSKDLIEPGPRWHDKLREYEEKGNSNLKLIKNLREEVKSLTTERDGFKKRWEACEGRGRKEFSKVER